MGQRISIIKLVDKFPSEESCREKLAQLRWNGEPFCPHCGQKNPYRFIDGKSYKCSNKECHKKFNVKTKTIFENSKLPLRTWFLAMYLFSAHKKGISSVQLSKYLEVTQKTAWFMMHRIRLIMNNMNPSFFTAGTIEIDETFVGGKNKNRHWDKKVKNSQGRSFKDKTPVIGLLHRETKQVMAFKIKDTSAKQIQPIIHKYIGEGCCVMTDEWHAYRGIELKYNHHYIDHGKGEYAKGNVTTNSIEGFWSHFKRGIIGVYHWISKKHLQRYCTEYSFRYNTKLMSEYDRMIELLSVCTDRLKYNSLIKN